MTETNNCPIEHVSRIRSKAEAEAELSMYVAEINASLDRVRERYTQLEADQIRRKEKAKQFMCIIS